MGLGASRPEPLPPGLADMPREHPMQHYSMQVRRGYDTCKEAANDLDPYNPSMTGIGPQHQTWRAEEQGIGTKIPVYYPERGGPLGGQKYEKSFFLQPDPLTDPNKRLEHGPCLPIFLQNNYINFREALAIAQLHAMKVAPARWYELQRADELSRFLSRGDVSVITKEELGDLGEALRHVHIAQANVRKSWIAPLKKNEQGVPYRLEGALYNAQLWGKATAAHGYRCREDEFLPPLKPSSRTEEEDLEDEEHKGGCSIM
jgi:hypothetical protein